MLRARPADLLIAAGVLVLVIGVLWRIGWLSWFGRLPGDVRIEGEGWSVFLPISSMIVTSAVLTVLVNIVVRVLGDR